MVSYLCALTTSKCCTVLYEHPAVERNVPYGPLRRRRISEVDAFGSHSVEGNGNCHNSLAVFRSEGDEVVGFLANGILGADDRILLERSTTFYRLARCANEESAFELNPSRSLSYSKTIVSLYFKLGEYWLVCEILIANGNTCLGDVVA